MRLKGHFLSLRAWNFGTILLSNGVMDDLGAGSAFPGTSVDCVPGVDTDQVIDYFGKELEFLFASCRIFSFSLHFQIGQEKWGCRQCTC